MITTQLNVRQTAYHEAAKLRGCVIDLQSLIAQALTIEDTITEEIRDAQRAVLTIQDHIRDLMPKA